MRTSCVIAALVAGLAGCAKPPAEPLRVVSSPWPGYEPLYLARDLGYLKESSVRITELPSSNITLEAFSNGSADVATLTLDEVVTLMSQGRKLRVLTVVDVSNGADAVVARAGIDSLAALKGRRLGMENIPLGVYILSRILDIGGLHAADITVVPLPEDKHEKAYRQKKIDAAITMEPFKTRLVNAGAHVLFDSRQIPDEIFDLVVAREDVYLARREELCQLTRQWFRTLDYIKASPDDAAARMSKRLGVDAAAFRASMDGLKVPDRQENDRLLDGGRPGLLVPARKLVDIMLNKRMIPVAVDVAGAIDPDFVRCSR